MIEMDESCIDLEIDDDHYGLIADNISEWEGKIAETLNLTESDVTVIRFANQWRYDLQK